MPKITSVEPQKSSKGRSDPEDHRPLVEVSGRNNKRFNIFIDGEFAFGADEDLVVSQRLIPGKVIDLNDLNHLIEEAEIGKLMEKMYGLFSVRQRSEKEVRDYFRIKNQELRIKGKEQRSQMVIDVVVEKLRQKGMVNDLEFAKAWIEGRRRSKQKSIRALKTELFQKGITKDVVDEALGEESRIKNKELSEEELAEKALEKKMRVWKSLDKQAFKKKAIEYLMRQGFEYSLIKSLVENILEKRYTTSSEIGDSPEENKNEDDF